jgi:riboflavin synthase alpha subunit
MFTGIVERTARVIAVADGPMFRRLTLASHWGDLRAGESIAINGVCLTVAEMAADRVGFDVIQETLSKTNLGLLQADDQVHVERSLRVGDRLDGHFVQGHVDGTAPLVAQTSNDKEVRLKLQCPAGLAKYLSPKGSVAVDGVSLTIATVDGETFEVALIPTTLQLTALGRREVGWPFNLEADILAKTVVSWLERQSPAAEDGLGGHRRSQPLRPPLPQA